MAEALPVCFVRVQSLGLDQILHLFNQIVQSPLLPVRRTFAPVMPRHSLLRRFVSFALALLVLTASVGLSVQRQTCRMSGRSKVNVSMLSKVAAPTGCNDQTTSVAQDHCCDFSSHLHQLTTPAYELAAKVLVPAPLLAVLPAMGVSWPMPTVVEVLKTNVPRWFAADSSPPPLGGRGLLAFVCTLTV